MNIYSHTLGLEAIRLKALCFKLLDQLRDERGEKLFHSHRKRIFFKELSLYVPLDICFSEDSSYWARFRPETYDIECSKHFLNASVEQQEEILLHELNHLITTMYYPHHTKAHGLEFQQTGKRFGLSDYILKAHAPLDESSLKQREKRKSKISALLNLSKGPNQHEATQALLKAQELMQKEGLTSFEKLEQTKDELTLFQVSLLKSKRQNQKMHSIGEIMKSLGFQTMQVRSQGAAWLDVLAHDSALLEEAKVAVSYLDFQFEKLWLHAKNEKMLKGQAHKNNYFKGLESGFLKHLSHRQQSKEKELMKITKALRPLMQQAYPHLRQVKVQRQHHHDAYSLGQKDSRHLKLLKSLSMKIKKQGTKLIGFNEHEHLK